MCENPANYFKKYRDAIGFSNQNDAKKFLSAKDISPQIDYDYIEVLNERIVKIVEKINIVIKNYNQSDLKKFTKKNILSTYEKIKKANLLPRLNNQGRRPESVLFSWLRGYAVVEFFTPSFSKIFNIPLNSIKRIGDDDLTDIETFRRSPKADLEITKGKQTTRIEVQSGFQGINDIKEHKASHANYIANSMKL